MHCNKIESGFFRVLDYMTRTTFDSFEEKPNMHNTKSNFLGMFDMILSVDKPLENYDSSNR